MGPHDTDKLAPFDYPLPEGQIARYPPKDRDGGRLLDLSGRNAIHRQARDFPDVLDAGDLLVVNDTRVLPARVMAHRKSGGRVEVFFLDGGDTAEVLLRPARRISVGEVLEVAGGEIEVVEALGAGRYRVRSDPRPMALMQAHGVMPLPPYIKREAETSDAERYQTIFAREAGAVAAPTAGLHISTGMVDRISARGVSIATVTLHVGIGTFKPLTEEQLDSGELHPERFRIPVATSDAIRATRERGGRIVAVGTTVVRALESVAKGDVVEAGEGTTTLLITRCEQFRVVDRLLTNFHLPKSSLLMLVCAFGGHDRVMDAYRLAIGEGYRFYSYGDAMFLQRQP